MLDKHKIAQLIQYCDVHTVGQQWKRLLITVVMAMDKHATVEGTVVFYGVCSEATTANATVGVLFVVCSRAI
jgi:hypothetical protein